MSQPHVQVLVDEQDGLPSTLDAALKRTQASVCVQPMSDVLRGDWTASADALGQVAGSPVGR
jgi:hypothetical protein